MSDTGCFFAASEQCVSLLADVEGLVYSTRDEAVLSRIVREATSSTLVLVIADEKESEKALVKTLCTHFAEKIEAPKETYIQLGISFMDDVTGDVVHYRCDRLSDINALIEEEHDQYRCCSLQASLVKPTEETFAFTDVRLTLMSWGLWESSEDLVQEAENVATMLGTRIMSVCVFFASGEASFLRRCLNIASDFRKACPGKVFGELERVSSHFRLQDVRSWSIFTNEFYRFAPLAEGPYLINLNPHMVVGEKLAHAVSRGVSYIVADASNASHADVVVLPAADAKEVESAANGKRMDVSHRSVYSPHCHLTYDGGVVYIRPECGMTYINGKLLSGETPLQHNDRIVLGTEVVLRFVVVSARRSPRVSSRILDWESCCGEFSRVSLSDIREAECNQLRREAIQLKEECEALQRQLQLRRVSEDGALLILNNPPSDCAMSFVWHLNWMGVGDAITIGPKGDVALPFLKSAGVITRTANGFTCDRDLLSLQPSHTHRFTIDDYVFTVCLHPIASAKNACGTSRELHAFTEDDVRELRNSLYELQWSVALLFDFAFPQKKARPLQNWINDSCQLGRIQINSDVILTEKKLKLKTVSRLAESMTEAIRMINFQLSDEIGSGPSTVKRDDVDATKSGAVTRELLEKLNGAPELSHALIRQVHQTVGRALIKMNAEPGEQSRNAACDLHPPSAKKMDDPMLGDLRGKLEVIKGKCCFASSAVVRRMKNVVDTFSTSPNHRQLWNRYIAVLDSLTKVYSDISGAPAVKKQTMALALVDVLVALDYNMRCGYLSPEEEGLVEDRLSVWMSIVDVCMEQFRRRVPYRRGASRNPIAALLRKPTPNPRRVSIGRSNATRRRNSRTGTPRGTNGKPHQSLNNRQPTPMQRAEAKHCVTSTGRSPRGLRSLSSFACFIRSMGNPGLVRSTSASPHAGERSGTHTSSRLTTTTIVYQTAGIAPHGERAVPPLPPHRSRLLSPPLPPNKSPLRRSRASDVGYPKKKRHQGA